MQSRRPDQKPRSTRRGWLLAGLFALALLAAGVAHSRPGVPGGPWQDAALVTGCPAGQICAEWPFSDGSAAVCCILQQNMGSTSYGDCVTRVGSRDPDGSYF